MSLPIRNRERLQKSVEVLTLIGNCRRATGDLRLGAGIERMIVDRELHEIEQQCAAEISSGTGDTSLEVVIPVRRIVDP